MTKPKGHQKPGPIVYLVMVTSYSLYPKIGPTWHAIIHLRVVHGFCVLVIEVQLRK